MQAELHFPVVLLYSFLLVLARVSGAVIFVPLPGVRGTADPVRVILILATTMALYPVWPVLQAEPSFVEYAGWLAIEAGFGLCMGLLVGFLAETALLFGNLCGIHAGFSYVTTVDPGTQAESPVLSTLAESAAGLMFVTLGLHRYVIRLFAHSLETLPPGRFLLNPRWSEIVIHAGATIFSIGLRLALPCIVLLVMVDLTLALLGRISANLQILQFAMPAKMLASMAIIGIILLMFPTLYQDYAERMLTLATAIAR